MYLNQDKKLKMLNVLSSVDMILMQLGHSERFLTHAESLLKGWCEFVFDLRNLLQKALVQVAYSLPLHQLLSHISVQQTARYLQFLH